MTHTRKLTRFVTTAVAALALSTGASLATTSIANAAEPVQKVAMVDAAQNGGFVKSSFKIKGGWTISKENGQTVLRLSEDFKTKNGPDLKIFLSPSKVANVTGATATNQAVKLSVLKSNKGAQDYIIPADIDLSQFGSILIHCEAYSKLWGGADL